MRYLGTCSVNAVKLTRQCTAVAEQFAEPHGPTTKVNTHVTTARRYKPKYRRNYHSTVMD